MKLPLQHALLLLAASPYATAAAVGSSSGDAVEIPRRASVRRPDLKPEIQPARAGARLDVGTKDAPVDGADGKPHAGPFVDSGADDTSSLRVTTSGSSKAVSDKQLPDDSVMNDPNRQAPKKGTTGTGGGVSEKSRQEKAEQAESGQRRMKKPEAPKEAPITDRLGPDDSRTGKQPIAAKEKESSADAPLDKSRGATGIEKPKDLTDRPRQIPHPEPPKSHFAEYPGDRDNHHFSKHDVDSEDELHDLIPWDSLFGSFSSIAATEIGDKTFIVAALMAMRHPRLQVFSAAFSALFVMTILSGVAGHAIGAIISKRWSALLAAILFLVFGAKSLKEGLEMSPDAGASDEIREVQAELEEKEADIQRQEDGRHRKTSSISPYALEAGRMGRPGKRSPSNSPSGMHRRRPASYTLAGVKNLLGLLLSPAWVETFSMTFVGELGDRSQIATVAMAAGQEYLWVMVGATLGHFVCTAIAVLGGSVLAGRVSMRKVTLAGGAIFVAFGIFTLYESTEYWR